MHIHTHIYIYKIIHMTAAINTVNWISWPVESKIFLAKIH